MTMTLINWAGSTANQKTTIATRLINLYQNRAWGPQITVIVARKNLDRANNFLIVDQVGSGGATRYDAAFLGGIRENTVGDALVKYGYVVFEPIVRQSVADKKAELIALAKFTIQRAIANGVSEIIWCFPDESPIGAWLMERGLLSHTELREGVTVTIYQEPASAAEAKL